MDIVFIFVYVLGWIAIICGIIFLYTQYRKTHHIPEFIESFLGLALLISFGVLGITLMNSYKQKIEDNLRRTQIMYCLGTKTSDEELLTENQCEYFRDVLDGRYYAN